MSTLRSVLIGGLARGILFLSLAISFGCNNGSASGEASAGRSAAESPASKQSQPVIEVCFTPPAGCAEKIAAEIAKAKTDIFVQAFSFTSDKIAKALAQARSSRVGVAVILDKGQRGEQYSSADFFSRADITVLIDASHAIAHNKVMVIDGEVVVTGSFNFTKSADERNAENVVIIRDRDLAAKYLENWRLHYKHSVPYEGKGVGKRLK